MPGNYVSIYWGPRKESRHECARRVAVFLADLAKINVTLVDWVTKGGRKGPPIILEPSAIGELFRTNNRDIDGTAIDELGFRFSVWNGRVEEQAVAVSITCGAFSPPIKNCAVVTFDPMFAHREEVGKKILNAAIFAFDPDSGVADFIGCEVLNYERRTGTSSEL
jgi:hypothetical protein